MNTTQPPFDDVHVRRAVNFVIDRDGLRKAWGGPPPARSRRTSRPTRFSATRSRATRRTAAATGDVEQGQGRDEAVQVRQEQGRHLRRQGLQEHLHHHGDSAVRADDGARHRGQHEEDRHHAQDARPQGRVHADPDAAQERPVLDRGPAGARTTPTPTTFFGPLFDGRKIIPRGNTNYSLLGITPAQAKKLGVKGTVTDMPSVNDDLDKCAPTLGGARVTCYAALDKKLMTQVVPWVPYLWTLRRQPHLART